MATERNYWQEAQSDAWDTLSEFVDEMVRQWRESGEVSDDLNNDYDGGDEYHHSTHVDKDYRLTEASRLLDELSEYEETDSGLWHGAEPRRAIAIQAAFTYGNAVYDRWRTLVENLNDHLFELQEAMHSSADFDTLPESAYQAAGERLIRLYVELREWERDSQGEVRALTEAAWVGALEGDRTAALVLADRLQEAGEDRRAGAIRSAVAAEAEADDESEAE